MTFASINMILNGTFAIERGVASLVHEVQEVGFSAADYCKAFNAGITKRVEAGTIGAASAAVQCSKVKRIVSAKAALVVDAWGAGATSLNALAAAMPTMTKKGAKKGSKKATKPAATATATTTQTIGENDGPGLTLGKLAMAASELRANLPKWTANQALLNAYDAYLVLLKAEAKAQQG